VSMCVCDGVMDVSESLRLCGVQVRDTLRKFNSVVAVVDFYLRYRIHMCVVHACVRECESVCVSVCLCATVTRCAS